ncbi:MAG: nucleotidyl transferase AbiEii/AbiGii toxin family protein [Bacilli bacterium]|nr:nucleotidyl transferase AbiEii/AbiGii toxin family protein [Bacilli bacterium]
MVELRNYEQLKAFLKKESKRLNLSIKNTYNTFFSRLLLYRLSQKNIDQSIIVKGSFAQFVHLRNMVRPITDIDITSIESHHDPFIILVNAMCNDEIANGIKYNLSGKPHQTYTGIYKIPISAKYGKIDHKIGIDYREKHPCIFEKEIKSVPKIFKFDEEYDIVVPSKEETLAEKLCIIVESNRPDLINTRIKDFYDIYQMHGGEYDLDKFSYYFERMLEKRGKIDIKDASTNFLTPEFVNKHQQEWEHSKKKYEFLDDQIDLEGSVYYTRAVLSEQLQKIRQGKNKIYTFEK